MKIEIVTKRNFAVAEAHIRRVMMEVAKDLGLSVQISGNSFSGLGATLKLEMRVAGAFEDPVKLEEAEFRCVCDRYPSLYSADWYGKTISMHIGPVRIVGINLARPKNDITVESVNTGARHVVSSKFVKLILGSSQAEGGVLA